MFPPLAAFYQPAAAGDHRASWGIAQRTESLQFVERGYLLC